MHAHPHTHRTHPMNRLSCAKAALSLDSRHLHQQFELEAWYITNEFCKGSLHNLHNEKLKTNKHHQHMSTIQHNWTREEAISFTSLAQFHFLRNVSLHQHSRTCHNPTPHNSTSITINHLPFLGLYGYRTPYDIQGGAFHATALLDVINTLVLWVWVFKHSHVEQIQADEHYWLAIGFLFERILWRNNKNLQSLQSLWQVKG